MPRVIGDYFNSGIGRLAIQADADSVLNVHVFGAEIDGAHADVGRSAPVQSFQGFLKTNPNPTRAELAHGVSGNLCRCQDYDKILTALMRGAEYMRRA